MSVLRIAICPPYWGRLWRYRWIVHASGLGIVADGYAWTLDRAGQDAAQAVGELSPGDRCG